jgi:hypothetical protein
VIETETKCDACGKLIPDHQPAFVHDGRGVCAKCHKKAAAPAIHCTTCRIRLPWEERPHYWNSNPLCPDCFKKADEKYRGEQKIRDAQMAKGLGMIFGALGDLVYQLVRVAVCIGAAIALIGLVMSSLNAALVVGVSLLLIGVSFLWSINANLKKLIDKDKKN